MTEYIGSISAGAMCPQCNEAVSAKLLYSVMGGDYSNATSRAAALIKDPNSIEAHNLSLIAVWPEKPEPRLPTHLTAGTESAFLQAERAFARGDTDAAGMMYRRALETGLKVAFPKVQGTLFARITALVATHDLPPAIGEWAHEVRLIGNEAAHDVDSLSPEDMTATRNFVDAVLRYAISLPAEIALRRGAMPPDPA